MTLGFRVPVAPTGRPFDMRLTPIVLVLCACAWVSGGDVAHLRSKGRLVARLAGKHHKRGVLASVPPFKLGHDIPLVSHSLVKPLVVTYPPTAAVTAVKVPLAPPLPHRVLGVGHKVPVPHPHYGLRFPHHTKAVLSDQHYHHHHHHVAPRPLVPVVPAPLPAPAPAVVVPTAAVPHVAPHPVHLRPLLPAASLVPDPAPVLPAAPAPVVAPTLPFAPQFPYVLRPGGAVQTSLFATYPRYPFGGFQAPVFPLSSTSFTQIVPHAPQFLVPQGEAHEGVVVGQQPVGPTPSLLHGELPQPAVQLQPAFHLQPQQPEVHLQAGQPGVHLHHLQPEFQPGVHVHGHPDVHHQPTPPTFNLQPVQPEYHLSPGHTDVHLQPAQPDYHFQPGHTDVHLQPAQPEFHLHPGQPEFHLHPGQPEFHLQPGQHEFHLQPGHTDVHLQPQPDYHLQGGQGDVHLQGGQPDYSLQGGQPEYNLQGGQPEYNLQGGQPEYNLQGQQPDYNLQGQQPEYHLQGGQPDYHLQPAPEYQAGGQLQPTQPTVDSQGWAPVPAQPSDTGHNDGNYPTDGHHHFTQEQGTPGYDYQDQLQHEYSYGQPAPEYGPPAEGRSADGDGDHQLYHNHIPLGLQPPIDRPLEHFH